MATYTTYPQQTIYPSYSTSNHHPASAHPNLYQTSAYSVPTLSSPPVQTMPTYYVSSSTPHQQSTRSRSRSRHSAQPIVYTTSSSSHRQHSSPRDYADSGRRRRASSVGHGGHYYTPSDRSPRHRSSSRSPRHRSSSRSPRVVIHTTSSPGHHDPRRSHSTSRHPSNAQYLDARHDSHGGRRPSVSYSDSGYHHPPSHSHTHHRRNSDSLGERFRRWFGGFGQHSSSRGTEYVDTRTGRTVDRSGRPVYRV
ncbi:uncharacterized protein PHACADRAFT_250296 [Phanerochaete carnosa HHB-10118-sp]|uniref:Uncharacterized protein n=1 Tax=Phanerochaete carnosa (strain HHB-10118-sp) TaxID=650164 RepID=K5WKH5_PHACS|nr:uncharacterized protein PHACADRAFT_250296 [Phanerochaete carnosa HHB-10118-sp]EKM59659.1 hypothetical protein PHACADRAFT_250296 [Phanerochaete carnosa HHB-10118-sp]